MNLVIKKAENDDLVWVNATYKAIDFLPSTLKDEIVAIAFMDDVKVGLARIAVIDKNSCELGGVFVSPEFRRQNIAKKLVEFLLKHAQKKIVYCIPYEHLSHFYERFGFRKINPDEVTPQKIKEKLEFCAETYREPTLLMVLYR